MPEVEEVVEPMYRCDDCGKEFGKDAWLNPADIKHYHERVEPGNIAPAGECDKCGALVFVIDKKEPSPKKVQILIYLQRGAGAVRDAAEELEEYGSTFDDKSYNRKRARTLRRIMDELEEMHQEINEEN